MTDMIPPQNLDAEQAVLGAVLLSERSLEPLLVELGLRASHFYRPSHGAIFEAMTALQDRGQPVDKLTVTAELKAAGQLEGVGGPAAVEILAATPPVTGNVRGYGTIVLEEARWRGRLDSAHSQIEAINKRDEDAYNAADASRHSGGRPDTTSRDQAALAAEWMDWYQSDSTGKIPLPFSRLTDSFDGGLAPGDTSIVAGWTSMGKSVFADQILAHAHSQGARGWAYLNEMSSLERTSRTIAGLTGIHFKRIMRRELDQERFKQAVAPAPVLRDLRNTGAWANDAPNVFFVHRDQDEDMDTGITTTSTDGHIRVAKGRNVGSDALAVRLDVRHMRFHQIDGVHA